MSERREVFGGYTDDELREAFSLVKNRENWKLPVDAVVPVDADMGRIDAAVAYFTGGGITQLKVKDGWRVLAAGYYACIGS
jgi:hypothetical protein